MREKRTSSVLIVDDNVNNLHVLANILGCGDIKVATVRDGSKALKFVDKKKPDLILLDVMMPEMNGYEVCRRLKEDAETEDIPVIFISALNQTEDKVKGFQCGGVDYITKPFRRDEVFARINVHLTLKHAQEDLKIANATKDKLFSIVAHDLRGPISSLSGMLEVVAMQPELLDCDTGRPFLSELRSSAQSLLHLIENLLAWAKNQRNAITYKPERISVNDLVEDNIELFSAKANEKNVSLQACIEEGVAVYADADMIMTVMRNLLSNALKFTPESGNVRIGASAQGEFVEISVIDDGVGIAGENMEKLFQIKEHFSTYGTRNEKGSGLGLLLCREFVEKNRGEIRAESEHGKGSRFILTLPAAEDCLKKS